MHWNLASPLALLVCAWPIASAHAAPSLRCSDVSIPIALNEGGPQDATMFGRLCGRGPAHKAPLQILIHGGSYDHRYWDGTGGGADYVSEITKAGFTTLAVDRIGVGRSTIPADGTLLTLHAAADHLHQVVERVRDGGLRSPQFGKLRPSSIQLVGFSFGSFIATIEASTYGDVDAVVLTAYSHTLGPQGEASFGLAWPALNEPQFASLPPTYLTTVPFVREQLFFYSPAVTSAVLQWDEANKQTYALGELMDIFPSCPRASGYRCLPWWLSVIAT